ncbi:MAG: phospholipid carrier-dependent glycosyltransferase [Anaerolineae bacterium]|nr:phospholipid carrier-dependent glycosyltransferase [Anaerolineae bacterium]
MKTSAYRWLLVLIDVLLLGGLMGYVIVGRDAVPFHGDESTLIHISRDYHTLVYDHNLDTILYDGPRVNYGNRFVRTTTGALSSFLMGVAWDINGFTVNDLNYGWDWSVSSAYDDEYPWYFNSRRGRIPTDGLLHTARTPSTLLGALSVLLVYGMARWMGQHRLAGWIAAVIYGTNPAVLVNGRRAMQEGATLLVCTLVILVALRVVQVQTRAKGRWQNLLRWYITFGIVAGLTVGIKQSAALIVVPAFLGIAAAPVFRAADSTLIKFDSRHGYNLAGIGTLAWLVTILLNPVWWFVPAILLLLGLTILFFSSGSPLSRPALWTTRFTGGALVIAVTLFSFGVWFSLPGGVFRVIGERADLIRNQVSEHGGMTSFSERIERLENELFFADAMYFEDPRWEHYAVTTQQIEDYEAAGLEGWSGILRGMTVLVCLILGLIALALRWSYLEAWILAAWLILPALGLLITNPLPWQRYYIILQAPLAVIGGFGVVEIARHIRTLTTHRAASSEMTVNCK